MFALSTEVRRAHEAGSYRLTERLGGAAWARCGVRHIASSPAHGHQADSAAPAARLTGCRRFPTTRGGDSNGGAEHARLRSPHTVNLFDFGVADDARSTT
jgi:hypothetical protein